MRCRGAWRDLLEVSVNSLPLLVYLFICVILPLRRGQFLLAWTHMQQAWLVGVLVWMNLICIFSSLMWGYLLTWLASGLMLSSGSYRKWQNRTRFVELKCSRQKASVLNSANLDLDYWFGNCDCLLPDDRKDHVSLGLRASGRLDHEGWH